MGIIIEFFFIKQKMNSFTLANEKMLSNYFKIMRSFCFTRWFKGLFSARIKYEK